MMLVENSEQTEMAIIIIAILILGVVQLYLGYIGIEDWLGFGWALGALALAIFARIMLPLTIGTYFAITNVYGYDWWLGLIIAAPGILFLLPQFLIYISDILKKPLNIWRFGDGIVAANNNNEISTNRSSLSRSYFTPPRVDFSVLLRDRKFITALYIFSICVPLALSGNFLIFHLSSIYSIFSLIIFGVIFVKWRLFYAVIIFPVLSAFLMWFVFGYPLSITTFSPFLLVSSFVLLFF